MGPLTRANRDLVFDEDWRFDPLIRSPMKVTVLSGRALALAILAWSLVKVAVDRLFGVRSGLALFHENYDADRLPPVTPDERALLPAFSRCIACGRCDIGEAERIARSRGEYPGLMAVVLASSRSMPDYDAAARALEHVPDEVLATKECPTNVPFVELARFVRSKARAVAAAPSNAAIPALPDDGDAGALPSRSVPPRDRDRLRLPSHA